MKHLKININKLEFAWEEVLKKIEFIFNQNDRISIVWPNWVWKTSLLKILSEEISNFDGNIENIWNLTIWYLSQINSDDENKLVSLELKESFKEIIKLENELKNLEEDMKIVNPESSSGWKLIEKYTEKLEQFNNIWWYDYQNKIHNVANWIWILHLLEKKLIEVSWWERTKIALSKVLLEEPDILLLDEPTNFIDMKSVEWLESYLKNKWKWWFLIVSHDREFLDKTCNKTIELQPKREATIYHSNYSNYLIEREKIEKKKLEEYDREQEFIKKQENLINRFRAWSRAWRAKSREKMIWKIDRLEKPYITKKTKFFLNYQEESSNKIITLKEVFIWRKEPLFFINEAILYEKQRVWIIWENWVGKSTLLKTIMGQIEILDWFISKAKWLKVVYYSQMHEELDKQKTVKDNFIKHWLAYPDENLIWLLKHYLFEKSDLDKKVNDLSWWQKSKLLFAILWQKESNLLILDEPTNHLDYDTREGLEFALNSYKWTILFISHDRYFVNKLATHIWFINNQELSISYWNYEDYKFKLENHLNMDFSLFDEEAQLNLVLQDKLSERQLKKMKKKFLK